MGDAGTLEIGPSDQLKPFNEIIESSKLPTVIKYDTTQDVDPYFVGSGFDSTQVYLLHTPHEISRILSRSVSFQPASKSFVDSGLDVTIDEQYDGWFAVFGSPSDHRRDPVVPHFRSVGKLSISQCQTFLVSGRQPLEGMKAVKSTDGHKTLQPFEILPGSVLTKIGMYTVTMKIKIKRKFQKSKVIDKKETYLACRDELQNEMMIACTASGVFYVISQVAGQVKTPIMKIEDIVARYTFPILVKLVHGRTFGMPSTFKGTFMLLKSQCAKVTFASTLYSSQPAVVEISADSPLRFYNFDSTNVLDLESNNESAAFSRAFEFYSNQMPSLLQTIRFRRNDQGLSSARSSSTSGHSSAMSDDEDVFDWSNIALCSNEPFIESVVTHGSGAALFTHHMVSPPTTIQTQISTSKDVKSKNTPKLKKQRSKDKEVAVSTTIMKTTMYDGPKAGPEVIHISKKRTASRQGNISATTPPFSDEDTPVAATSLAASPSSETYGTLWGDTSSVVSGESLEVVVESVMHTDLTGRSQNADFSHEYKNISSELAATVRLRNKSRKSLDDILDTITNNEKEEKNQYDVLCDYRNTIRGSYHHLTQPEIGLTETASAFTLSESSLNNEENATETDSPDCSHKFLSIRSSHTYEEPTPNHEPYMRPDSGHYELLEDAGQTITRSANYDTPKNGTCITTPTVVIPQDGPYVMPTPDSHYETQINEEENSYQDDGVDYENLDHVYYSIADTESCNANSTHYENISPYMNSGSASLNCSKSLNNTGLYFTTPLSNQNNQSNNHLYKLLLSLKNLGLKRATEEAIKSVDPKEFESCFEGDKNWRNQLCELLPSVSKIDINKISCFLDTQ